MRRPLTSTLPSYPSDERIALTMVSVANASAENTTPTHWFTRWWLLYVMLGCCTITVLSFSMVEYVLTPLSFKVQQNEFQAQQQALSSLKVINGKTDDPNELDRDWSVQRARTSPEAFSKQEHNQEAAAASGLHKDVRSKAATAKVTILVGTDMPAGPPTATIGTLSADKDSRAAKSNNIGGTHRAEAGMESVQLNGKGEDSGRRGVVNSPVALTAPFSDKARPPVRRSSEFYRALDLVYPPETKASSSKLNYFPLNKILPGDDATLISGLRNNTADRSSWSAEAYQQEVNRLLDLKREANEEIERLKELIGAADRVISEEKGQFEDRRAALTLDIRLQQPRKIRNRLKCMGWRQTGQCSSNGQREPKLDLGCTQIAHGGMSGYCEVLDEDTGELFRVMQLNCSSLREHVVFSCAEAADFANFGLSAQKIYENAQAQNASDSSKLLGNHGSGNGIVMVVYPKLISSVYASLSVLQSYNCTLPIELWISQHEVIRTPSLKIALGLLQQHFPHATVETITDPTIAGFSTKIHAVYHSRFENVLFLDADNVPVRDPTFLFESQEFREHGAIFWPDFWHPEKTIFNIQSDSLLWQLVDLPFVDTFEQESGQLVINRRRAALALEVLMFFASHRPSHFSRLVLVHGDKDLFRLAWMKAKTPFYMIPFPPAAAGPERKEKFCGMTMVQFDCGGNILFLHRNAKKLDATVDNLNLKIWTHLQLFTWEQLPTGVDDNPSDLANKSAVQRMMSYEDIKQKYKIGITNSLPLFTEVENCYGAEPNVVGNFTVIEFKKLPFGMLEDKLIDYAHDGALLMAQARNRVGTTL